MADDDQTRDDGDTHNSVGGEAHIDTLVQSKYIGRLYLNQPEQGPALRTPQQLRPDDGHFVGREQEQLLLLRSVSAWEDDERPLVATLRGLAGVGKTTLGHRVARTLRKQMGGGQGQVGVLYVDLEHHRRDGGVDVSEALAHLLRGFGLRGAWLPTAVEERADRYLELTRDHRLVVVIDNVRSGAEAVPLLPDSEKSVAVLVSHAPLYDLARPDVVDVHLAPLTDEEALRLLSERAGGARLAEDPETARRLIRLCGGLPLLLAAAAQQLRRHPLRRLVRVFDEFGRKLREAGLPETEAVLDTAYDDMSERGRLLYRLLATAPDAPLALAAVVALLGEDRNAADDAVEELLAAGLAEVHDGHLHLHGLVRAHAARRATDQGLSPASAAAARLRLVRWYLRQAQLADLVIAGTRLTLAERADELPGAPDARFADKGQALRWLESERAALYACVRLAYEDTADTEAWALCEPLWTHYLDHPHYEDVLDAFGTAIGAAARSGHLAALTRMRCQRARPLWEQRRFTEAEQELTAAVSAAEALSDEERDRRLRASALEFRGKLHAVQEQWEDAVPYYEESLSIHRGIGNDYGVLLLTHLSGQAAAGLGRLDRARDLLASAHAMALAGDRERMTARTGFELGRVLERLERPAEASELYEAALAGARRRGSTFDEARILDTLGGLAERAGDEAAARAHRERAARIRVAQGGTRR
ncbi:tetratricopeptide repeat protein [Streptomyces acidicola]|uniref:tetratricopeptide repeat protein n=1 Tax=Streptomyces acidicola TaxID=2596892 RepID=UPI002AD4872D|nr:tetratricopeptide repeat protein [Streptomyces acidicola]